MQGFREYDCFELILKVFVYILDSVNVSKKIVFLVVRSEGGGKDNVCLPKNKHADYFINETFH